MISSSLCLMAAAFTGCNGGTTSVSGEVTYNGVPVENGYVTFNPVGKGRAFAAPVTNGTYTVDKPTTGKFTAVAAGYRKLNHYSSSAEAYAHAQKNGGHVSEAADYIAPDAAGNSKQVEIISGDQQLDFAITGPPMPQQQ